ncbi:MAG: hypothetical protein V4773_18365 [Verrucomicrobiota bacterium]
MKNDPYFKLVAAVILAGVIVAFASPSATNAASQTPDAEPVAAPATALTE